MFQVSKINYINYLYKLLKKCPHKSNQNCKKILIVKTFFDNKTHFNNKIPLSDIKKPIRIKSNPSQIHDID